MGRGGRSPRTSPDEGTPEERFLRLLDPDPSVALEKCEQLRTRLVYFFKWRQCTDPDDLAQITMMRVYEKAESGMTFERADNTPYFFAVANFVLKEARRVDAAAARISELSDQLAAPSSQVARVEDDIALGECLAHLDPDDRTILVGYVVDGLRDELCGRFGLSRINLRVKVHRLMKDVKARARSMGLEGL